MGKYYREIRPYYARARARALSVKSRWGEAILRRINRYAKLTIPRSSSNAVASLQRERRGFPFRSFASEFRGSMLKYSEAQECITAAFVLRREGEGGSLAAARWKYSKKRLWRPRKEDRKIY